MRTPRLTLALVLLVAVVAGWLVVPAGELHPAMAAARTQQPAEPALVLSGRRPAGEPRYRSPTAVCASADGRFAYVVDQTADSIVEVDIAARSMGRDIAVGAQPSHAVLSKDGRTLFVSCTYDYTIDVVDLAKGAVVRRLPVGFEPIGLSLSPDGARLCVVNSLAGTVMAFDVASGERRYEVAVGKKPRFLADTGELLVVTNAESRDVTIVAARSGKVVETRSLGRSAQLRGVACTGDGRFAMVATLVSHDEMITTQMDRGWINSNGFAVLDLQQPGHYVTLLLDRVLSGATNPWGVAIAADQQRLFVSLAGIHQVAVIDLPAVLRLVAATPREEVQRLSQEVELLERQGLAQRVDAGGLGPRGIACSAAGNELLVADYFSDAMSVLDGTTGALKAAIAIGPQPESTRWREGELRFNDGRICFENWLSCASCHEENGTVDSLNWDLINDGMGNPKNAKSLHNGIFEPPAMWSGVRQDQPAGVMAGQRFLGFLPDDDVQAALMQFLAAPPRAPNPFRDVDAALLQRGRTVFLQARCDVCHVAPKFTDQKMHDIGLSGFTSRVDFRARFDTPSLIECYRTAPYLHDGRAASLRDIFTVHNPDNGHGLTRGLGDDELDALVAYLRSL